MTVMPLEPFDEESLLRLVASLENASEHPLAGAIVTGATERGVKLADVTEFESITGQGVVGVVESRHVAVGNLKLLESMSVDVPTLREKADELRRNGQTVMFIAVDRRAAGLVGVADPVKATTPEAIEALHREGVKVVMLTGDNRTTAEAVARSVGIDQIEADVLPDQKAAVVKRLQERGERVAMAGDGVNDAPALAAADVGIAMGTGTDIAIESAGVTLVKGDLRGIVRARRLSKATMSNIRQNLFFAFVYNVLGVPVAAGVLHPFLGLLLSPMIKRCDDLQFRVGHRQCASPEAGFPVKRPPCAEVAPGSRLALYSKGELETSNQPRLADRPDRHAGVGNGLRDAVRFRRATRAAAHHASGKPCDDEQATTPSSGPQAAAPAGHDCSDHDAAIA